LQRGAIFGRRFWTGGVEALGVSAGAEMLGHLQPRGFVEAQPESAIQGDTEWSFHQNLLQEVTYESVLKRERLALHKVAAAWLEKQARQAGRLDEFAGLLGDHCERAGELSAAADWYLRAGGHAFSQGAPREAAGFYTHALELLPPVDREHRWQALLGREEALSVLGDAEPWRADISALLELARTYEDETYLAEAYFRQAICGMRTGEESIFNQASRKALEAAQHCGNEAIEAKSLALVAIAEINPSEKSMSIEHIEEALRKARLLADESVLSFVFARAAFCYGEFGNFDRWYPLYIEQIELDHRLGNRSQEAVGLGNLGASYVSSGLYKQGRSLIEQSIVIDKALGARRMLAYDLMNLGEIHLNTGDLRKALQLTEQALEEISPTQDARGKIFVLNNLGRVLQAMRDAPGASRRFTEACQLAMSHGHIALVCESTTGLAACAIMQGQLDEARKNVQEAWDYLKEHGWMGMGLPGYVYRTCAEIFDALDDAENSWAVIESGYQAIMDVVNEKNIPTWRQSFLENVPDHRWIMEMWESRKL
jgi:tetratricopeptide (TPR) repeat protein